MEYFTLEGGAVRGLLIDSTEAVRRAQTLQNSSAVAAAALGRGLTAAAMLSSTLKENTTSVTLTIDGDGPLKKIVCIGSPFADSDGTGGHRRARVRAKPHGAAAAEGRASWISAAA